MRRLRVRLVNDPLGVVDHLNGPGRLDVNSVRVTL
jgi:hypothetical protein